MVIPNNTVVNNCDTSLVIEVRMSINISLITVGGPASMSDSDVVVVL